MKKLTLLLPLCILYAHTFCKTANNGEAAPPRITDTVKNRDSLLAIWEQKTLKPPACKGKKIYIQKGGDNGKYLNGSYFSYNPGDTLVLRAQDNPFSYFSLENFYGTADCPLTIINEGGQVTLTNGMALANCRFINITGGGTKKVKYGFRIEEPNSNGVGVDIHGRSSFIEVQNFFIYHKTYGFWVKQEASCVDSLQYPNWTINNIYLHNNYILKMNQEGMYLGSTDPNGSRTINCNGKIINPVPLRLGNIKVYNNIIDSTNRSGIQLSCGSTRLNEIFNNTVTNCGFEFSTNQGNGISIGGYTRAHIYNNYVNHTYALGIMCLGSGRLVIENNTIDNSGELGGRKVNGMANIMIDTRFTNPSDSTRIFVRDNKTGANTDFAVRVYKTYNTYRKENIICNSGSVYVASGVDWTNNCGYKDEMSEEEESSFNTGKSSELQKSGLQNQSASIVFPNPSKDVLHVTLPNDISGKILLNIYNETGNLISSKNIDKSPGTLTEDINVSRLSNGIYILQILSGAYITKLKFLKAY